MRICAKLYFLSVKNAALLFCYIFLFIKIKEEMEAIMIKKFKQIIISTTLLVLFVTSTMVAFAKGNEGNVAESSEYFKDSANNGYVAGYNSVITSESLFSNFGVGYNVTSSKVKTEDAACYAGYNVSVNQADIGGSAFLAGYSVNTYKSDIKGNLVASGYNINVDDMTSATSVIAAGAFINVAGTADSAMISGGEVYFSGNVNGDVNIEAEKVYIDEDACITGKLIVKSVEEPVIPNGAKIGSYKWIDVQEEASNQNGAEKIAQNSVLDAVFVTAKSAVYWSIAMVLLGLIFCWLMPKELVASTEMVKTRTAAMLGSGAVTLFAMPIAFIVALCTGVGAPVAGIVVSVFVLILVCSVTFTGAALGRMVFSKLNPILGSLIGIVILEVVKVIPFLGTLIFLASAIYSLGFFIQSIYLKRIVAK